MKRIKINILFSFTIDAFFDKLTIKKCKKYTIIHSRLSLTQLPLSQITAYLKVKIWSLFKQENLITGYKLLLKEEKLALI